MQFRGVLESGSYAPYPFSQMTIGDELHIPTARCDKRSANAAILRFLKKHPEFHFLRPVEENKHWVIRRVAPPAAFLTYETIEETPVAENNRAPDSN